MACCNLQATYHLILPKPWEVNSIMFPILQMRKLRPKEVKWPKNHTAGKFKRWVWNPGS